MDQTLGEWCVRWLSSPVSEVLFEAGSLSAVSGVRLADGRDVVVKVRRPMPRLRAAYVVQRHLWQSGYPAPEPLVAPVPFGTAECASAEQLVRGGDSGGRGPGDAARSAGALAWLLRAAPAVAGAGDLSPSPPWVAWDHAEAGLWPALDDEPGDLNLVPAPAWLDEAGTRCRERLRRYQAPRVIGHADWHADNVLWSGAKLLVVHDWDSVVCQPEAVIVGMAAAMFPASGAAWQPATIKESDEFITAYMRASATAWTPDDVEACWAATVWTRAFDAKEQSADGPVTSLTETEARERLSRAGA
jgi:Phosphotransferase enzyme family